MPAFGAGPYREFMRYGGAISGIAIGLFLAGGAAHGSSIELDISLNSEIGTSVTLSSNGNGDLPASTAMTLALSNGVMAPYSVQYQTGILGAPSPFRQPSNGVYENIVFAGGPLHIWPVNMPMSMGDDADSPNQMFS